MSKRTLCVVLLLAVSAQHASAQEEIERDRLMQGDEREAAIVDLHLEIVDAGIAGNDVGRQPAVPLDKASHGRAQMIFRDSSHRQQARLQLVHFVSDTAILVHRFRHDAAPLHSCYETISHERIAAGGAIAGRFPARPTPKATSAALSSS